MTPFQQIALDLVQDGLVKNKDWVPVAGERAARCFSRPDLQRAAAFLAALHPFAIDYIEQAPVLVLVATAGRRLRTRQDRLRVAHSFIMACEPGPRLGKLMRHYGLAPQLRALNGHILQPDHTDLLKLVGFLPGARLAQVLAREPAQQAAWLAAAQAWTAHMRRYADNPRLLLGWALQNLRSPASIPEIVRLAEELGDDFNTDWTEKAAKRACEDARTAALARHQCAMRSAASPMWAQTLDVTPFPSIYMVGSYSFLALQTLGALESEGRSMHHCVGSYGNRAVYKTSRLFSVFLHGRRIATLDVASVPDEESHKGRAFVISELRGHYNANPDLATLQAAWQFVDSVNARVPVPYIKPTALAARTLREKRQRIVDLVAAKAA